MTAVARGIVILAVAVVLLLLSGAVLSDDSEGASLCSVVLEGNGGTTEDGGSTISYQVISGQQFVLPCVLFERSGAYLSGWTSSDSGTFAPGDPVTISKSIVFTAQWAVPEGTFDESVSKVVAVGETYTFTVDSDDRDWTEFLDAVGGSKNSANAEYIEWISKPDCVTYTFEKKAVTTGIFATGMFYTFTVTVQPTEPGVYPVVMDSRISDQSVLRTFVISVPGDGDSPVSLSFDMDGGTGTLNAMKGPIGSAYVLPELTGSDGDLIQRDGCTLVGWRISDGAGSYPIYPLGSLYTLRFDAVAEAYWVDDPNVLVYSLDGGSLENVRAYVLYDGEDVTLAKSGVTKDGYTFLGWRPSQDRDIAYAPGYVMGVEGSMYMEAWFVEDGTPVHTITYDANGGTASVASQKTVSGVFVKLPTSKGMVREGNTFLGWSLDRDGELYGFEDYPRSAMEPVTSDVTLYAVWEENDVDPEDPEPAPVYCNVVFDTDGGTGTYRPQRILSGGLASRPADPELEGHVFMGWRSLTSSQTWDFSSDRVTSDTVLKAVWQEHFTISFEGSVAVVNISSAFFDMAFDIWWGDGSSEVYGPSVGTASHDYGPYTSFGEVMVISRDAVGSYRSVLPYSVQGEHWNPPVDWTVTFDPDNGEGCWDVVVDIGDAVDEPADPVKAGHAFTGWYSEGALWDFDTVVTRDMTLTAGWDGVVPDDPDEGRPVAIVPKAAGRVDRTEDGWLLDATSSSNAMSYMWFVDGSLVGARAQVQVDDGDLSVGVHKVLLKVSSTTGHSDSWSGTIVVEDGAADDGDGIDGLTAAVIAAAVLIALIVAVRRFV